MKYFLTIIFSITVTLSFSQACLFDTNRINVDIWKINRYNNYEYEKLDTSLHNFQIFQPAEIGSFSNTDLGTLTSPRLSNLFFERPLDYYQDFFFFTNYQNSLYEPHNFRYYKTDKPLTDVFYSTTPKAVEEIYLDVIHTQNIDSSTNIGVKYSLATSKEPSTEQNSAQNHFTTWYSHTRTRHDLQVNFYSNRIKIIENGGIDDTDTTQPFNREIAGYFLNNVRTKMTNTGLFVNQNYKLGFKKTVTKNDTATEVLFVPRATVGHIFNISSYSRKYYESASTSDFYGNELLQEGETYDSVHFTQIVNTFHLKTAGEKFLGIKAKNRVAISSELNSFYEFQGYLYARGAKYQHNTFLTASIADFKIKKFTSSFYLKYYLQGVKIGDFDFHGNLNQELNLWQKTMQISVNGRYLRSEPGYFLQKYNGNHDNWEQSLKKTNYITGNFAVNLQNFKMKLDVNTALLTNYIYFDTISNPIPKQHNKAINVNSVSLQKTFKAGVFVFDNKIAYQVNTSNQILNLPALTVFNSTYADFMMFKRVLRVNAGFQVYYTTPYKSYNYQPSTGAFYVMPEKSVGNYPLADVFVNFKLKTTLMFFKLEHANARLLQDYYFSTNHYHAREYFFRFGIRWWFRT